jgi:hypothetical protein
MASFTRSFMYGALGADVDDIVDDIVDEIPHNINRSSHVRSTVSITLATPRLASLNSLVFSNFPVPLPGGK